MKILVIRLSSLGDIILTQPVLGLLQDKYPEAEIYYLTKDEFKDLPTLFPNPPKLLIFRPTLGFLLSLRALRFDLVIDLHVKMASMLASAFSGAPHRVRYKKQRSIRKAIVKGNKGLRIDSTVESYVSSLNGICDTAWQYPRLSIIPTSGNLQRIALFPGATHGTKCYPSDKWIEFINLNSDYHFAIFGGKKELSVCQYIASMTVNSSNMAGKLSLKELVSELSHYGGVISGDTGPMHIAAAMNLPQIAIFGGTHPRLGFRPLNDKAVVLCAELPCQPCHLHGRHKCPLGHFNCMNNISPQLITDTLRTLSSHR